jgi:4-amino-4-deoxy-L-arabinose transferase-like glycosyltransferase
MALVVALFCVPLFVGTDRTDVENDEAGYSFGVEMMVEEGDWLTPRGIYDGVSPFLEKPPLKFWIVGLPIEWGLLPSSPFGLRFWDALMGSLAFLYVFAIGRRLAGPVCGAVAVLLLFTHPTLIFQHGLRTNNMEAPLLLQYAGTMYHYLAWRSAGGRARGHLAAIALYFVLGFMTKFVAALFAPLVILVMAALTPEDRRRLLGDWRGVAMSALVATMLIAPWFVYQYVERGPRLFQLMFGEHVVRRFTSFMERSHVQPWDYYFVELWGQIQAPATRALVVLGAVFLLVRVLRGWWREGALIALWFVVPMAVLSMGTSKLYHYIYPFLPPVALAGGYAAALFATWTWRVLERPAGIFVGARDRVWPRALDRPWARAGLVVVGVSALAAAVATYLFGPWRVAIGSTLVRNSSVVRPILVGVAAFVAAAPVAIIRVLLGAAVVLAPLPVAGYRATLEEIGRVRRPLSDVRACLAPVVEQSVAEGQKPPGVWVEARSFGHVYYYYFRGLGPWQARNVASDATVAMHLFTPDLLRPVLLSRERFEQFSGNLVADEQAVLDAAAKKAEVNVGLLIDQRRSAPIGIVDLDHEVFLLPGRFRACATGVFSPS